MHSFLSSLLGRFLLISLASLCFSTQAEDDAARMLRESREFVSQMRGKIENPTPTWAEQYDAQAATVRTRVGETNYLEAVKEMTKDADRIREQAVGPRPTMTPTVSTAHDQDSWFEPGEELILFASFNMPKAVLKEMLAVASELGKSSRIVFRGIKEEHTAINHTMIELQQLAVKMELDPLPRVQIDPRYFYMYGITEAPSMVYRSPTKTVVAAGIQNVVTFVEASRKMQTGGHLGVLSATYAITERDIVEEIKSRVANVDWDKKKKEAIKRYIRRHSRELVPEATKQDDTVYTIDPRVQFIRDSKGPDGTLFAAAGDVVDPTQLFTMKNTLFIVDPTRAKQVALVKKELLKKNANYGLKQVLISRLEEADDFELVGDIQRELGQQVFLLQPEIVDKFQLKSLPARVEISKGRLLITEYGQRAMLQAVGDALTDGAPKMLRKEG